MPKHRLNEQDKRPTVKRICISIIAFLAIAGAGSATLIATASDDGDGDGSRLAAPSNTGSVASEALPPPPPRFDEPRVLDVEASQAKRFKVLRDPQRPGDSIAASSGLHGANRALARTIRTKAGDVAVVPAHGHICLEINGAATCAPNDEAVDGNLVLSEYAGDDKLIRAFVLVPDGATNVRVHSGATTVSAQPTRNVLAVDDPDASSVSYSTPDQGAINQDL